ncbi:MAG: LapA family protein [Hyphomicrobiales bacterium]
MKRLIQFLVFAPLAIFLIAISVANRKVVTLSFDPFSATDPAISLSLPLFWLIFASLFIGVAIGGFVVWMKQGRFRKEARDQKFEAAKARHEAKVAKTETAAVAANTSNILLTQKAS